MPDTVVDVPSLPEDGDQRDEETNKSPSEDDGYYADENTTKLLPEDYRRRDMEVAVSLPARGGSGQPVNTGTRDKMVERHLRNCNNAKTISSSLLNTASLSSNASLLAILLKQDPAFNSIFTAISIALISGSVLLQILTAIFLALEYQSTQKCEDNQEQLNITPKGAEDEVDGFKEIIRSWAKPKRYQFIAIVLLMLLNVVNTFIVPFATNADVDSRLHPVTQ